MPLPYLDDSPPTTTAQELTKIRRSIWCSLDGFSAIAIPQLKNKEEEEEFLKKFLSASKNSSKEDNWTLATTVYSDYA
jgi:hypothetical protein